MILKIKKTEKLLIKHTHKLNAAQDSESEKKNFKKFAMKNIIGKISEVGIQIILH